MSKAISVSTRPIFTIFLPYGMDLREFFRSGLVFFRFLKGRCHGNQFCGKIVAKLPTPWSAYFEIKLQATDCL